MQRHGLHRTQTPLRHNTQIPPRHPCLKTGAFRNARSVKDEPWLPKLNPAAAARYDALVTCCASSNGPTHLPGIHHDDPQPKTRRPSLRPPSMRRAPSPLLSINIYFYNYNLQSSASLQSPLESVRRPAVERTLACCLNCVVFFTIVSTISFIHRTSCRSLKLQSRLCPILLGGFPLFLNE